MRIFVFYIIVFLYPSAKLLSQGYKLINVEKVSVLGIGFADNEPQLIEEKIGKPTSLLREYDSEMDLYRIECRYDSLMFEFTESKTGIYLDFIEILSPKYKLQVADSVICVGNTIDRLAMLFPLAHDNYIKGVAESKINKDAFKAYMKYDKGGEWVFYGKLIFKLKGRYIQSIYVVFSPEF